MEIEREAFDSSFVLVHIVSTFCGISQRWENGWTKHRLCLVERTDGNGDGDHGRNMRMRGLTDRINADAGKPERSLQVMLSPMDIAPIAMRKAPFVVSCMRQLFRGELRA